MGTQGRQLVLAAMIFAVAMIFIDQTIVVLAKKGARPTVVPGCAIAAVGFYLWGAKLDALSFTSQWIYLAIAGAGVGLVLGPVSTDAVNRASRATYGAVTA
jgi:hypothetical protein